MISYDLIILMNAHKTMLTLNMQTNLKILSVFKMCPTWIIKQENQRKKSLSKQERYLA